MVGQHIVRAPYPSSGGNVLTFCQQKLGVGYSAVTRKAGDEPAVVCLLWVGYIVDNVTDRLALGAAFVEFVLPLQYGIEVVGLVGALPGPEKGYPDHVADDLFQRLAVLLVHRQQEKGQHDKHHAQGGGAVPGCPRSRKKSGTPTSAPLPKQTNCRLVRLKATFVLTFVKSLGTGT